MAWVLEVENPRFPGTSQALKLIKPEVASSEEFVTRFENEARILAEAIKTPFDLAGPPLYEFTDVTPTDHPVEFVLFILLGAAAAIGGWLFIRALRDSRAFFGRLPIPGHSFRVPGRKELQDDPDVTHRAQRVDHEAEIRE